MGSELPGVLTMAPKSKRNKIEQVTIDAARQGYKTAAEIHGITIATVRSYVKREKPLYAQYMLELASESKKGAFALVDVIQRELRTRISSGNLKDPKEFPTPTLFSWWEKSVKVFKEMSQVETMVPPKNLVLKGLADRDPEMIKYFREIVAEMDKYNLAELLNHWDENEAGDNNGLPEEAPESEPY